jgi:arylsulfatase A-like enzyme
MIKVNILLIHADQHRADCMGVNGHILIQTPNLDELARAGINFRQAFCPIPLCTPARASLLTGLWPTQHGSIANAQTEAFQPLLPGLTTFSQLLKEGGYYLGYVGKWGVDEKRDPTQFGFDDYISEKAYSLWREQQGLPPVPRKNRWFGEVDPGIKPEQSRLAWGATQTIGLLEKAKEGDQPFFIRWDPSEPHLPNIVPEPYASMYAPAQIEPWPSFPDPLEDKPYIQKQQLRSWGLAGWGWADWAPIVARYLGQITLLDHQIGRVLAALADFGLAEETLVVYSSDHGDLCGAHGMIDKHFVMYDDVVRVPLLMRWPGKIAANQSSDAFVCSALDLASTFCEAARVAPPPTFMGQSLLPLTYGQSSGSRPDIFATYHGSQFGLYSQRMVRDRRWKYIWNATAEDELYDLETDPAELANLAGRAQFAPQLARLRGRLLEWLEATQDRLLNSWTRQQLANSDKL